MYKVSVMLRGKGHVWNAINQSTMSVSHAPCSVTYSAMSNTICEVTTTQCGEQSDIYLTEDWIHQYQLQLYDNKLVLYGHVHGPSLLIEYQLYIVHLRSII